MSVSITLPGRVMYSFNEAKAVEKLKKGAGFTLSSMTVTDDKGKNAEVIHIRTRNCVPAVQTIKMNKEAYYYMTSKESRPNSISEKHFNAMKPEGRLQAHLDILCKSLGGISYSYKVFDD